MKVEFELNINSDGEPIIKFRHHDKSDSLEQKILSIFLKGAKEKGIELNHTSGFLESGTNNSHENYEIKTKR